MMQLIENGFSPFELLEKAETANLLKIDRAKAFIDPPLGFEVLEAVVSCMPTPTHLTQKLREPLLAYCHTLYENSRSSFFAFRLSLGDPGFFAPLLFSLHAAVEDRRSWVAQIVSLVCANIRTPHMIDSQVRAIIGEFPSTDSSPFLDSLKETLEVAKGGGLFMVRSDKIELVELRSPGLLTQ